MTIKHLNVNRKQKGQIGHKINEMRLHFDFYPKWNYGISTFGDEICKTFVGNYFHLIVQNAMRKA